MGRDIEGIRGDGDRTSAEYIIDAHAGGWWCDEPAQGEERYDGQVCIQEDAKEVERTG